MNGYYPTAQELKTFQQQNELMSTNQTPQFLPGMMKRTDGFDVDKTMAHLNQMIDMAPSEDARTNIENLKSRLISVSDLSENLYDHFNQNPNELSNWYPAIDKAVQNQSFFKTPDTKVWTLPMELAQFIRLEYQETNSRTRDLFNQLVFDYFELEDDKTYFIKTGMFSSKFEFRNAKCSEPREMGDYFIVINNYAMEVGAGQSIDLVVREYIEDPEDRPTIYNGMPLRTEFRAFVDFDSDSIIGVVPYWFPSVMKNRFQKMDNPTVAQDYYTYMAMEDTLMHDYEKHLPDVKKHLSALLADVDLSGRYSVDIMKSGQDFYIIDCATMETSAMADFVTGEGIVEY